MTGRCRVQDNGVGSVFARQLQMELVQDASKS
jgi:hypothetical protein